MFVNYRCFWALPLLYLIGITTHAAFFPVLQCLDVDLKQDSMCTDSNHKLHCIVEKDACQPGLVCLPWSWIEKNICPIYSKSTAGMKYHSCIGDDTQCPYNVTLYKSFEAYKYPGCYVCENKLPTTTTRTTTVETKSHDTTTETKSLYTKHQLGVLTEAPPVTTQTLENNRSSDLLTYVYVLIVLLMISVLLNIILIVLFRKQISKMLKRHICCNNTEKKKRYERQIFRKNKEKSLTRPSCIQIEDPEMKSTTKLNAPESEKIDDPRSPEEVPMVDSRSPEEELILDYRSPEEELMVDPRSPEETPVVDSGSPEEAKLIDLQTKCSADQNEEEKDIEHFVCAKQNDEAGSEVEETRLSEPLPNRSEIGKSLDKMIPLDDKPKIKHVGIDRMNKDPNVELRDQVKHRDNPGFDQ